MLRIARVAEQGPHEWPVVAQNLDLAVERDGEPGRERLVVGGFGGDAARVLFRDPVVVGEDDRVLAGEVVVGGAEGHVGGGRDVAHGRRVEPAAAKKLERGAVDAFSGVFAFRGDSFEHVQLQET